MFSIPAHCVVELIIHHPFVVFVVTSLNFHPCIKLITDRISDKLLE